MVQDVVYQIFTDGDVLNKGPKLALSGPTVLQLCAHAVALDLQGCNKHITAHPTHQHTAKVHGWYAAMLVPLT